MQEHCDKRRAFAALGLLDEELRQIDASDLTSNATQMYHPLVEGTAGWVAPV